MSFRVLRRRDHTAMAWRNGGGRTLEAVNQPPAAGLDAFDWRVSFAEVTEPGPFSLFPGIDRLITLVRGRMTLSVEEADVELVPSVPYAFAGEAAVCCSAGGPSLDLNVMTRRGRCAARVECIRLVQETRTVPHTPGAEATLIAVLDGHLRVMAPSGTSIELSALDVLNDVDPAVVLGGTGTVAVISIFAGSDGTVRPT